MAGNTVLLWLHSTAAPWITDFVRQAIQTGSSCINSFTVHPTSSLLKFLKFRRINCRIILFKKTNTKSISMIWRLWDEVCFWTTCQKWCQSWCIKTQDSSAVLVTSILWCIKTPGIPAIQSSLWILVIANKIQLSWRN